jgi:hypothetical protein
LQQITGVKATTYVLKRIFINIQTMCLISEHPLIRSVRSFVFRHGIASPCPPPPSTHITHWPFTARDLPQATLYIDNKIKCRQRWLLLFVFKSRSGPAPFEWPIPRLSSAHSQSECTATNWWATVQETAWDYDQWHKSISEQLVSVIMTQSKKRRRVVMQHSTMKRSIRLRRDALTVVPGESTASIFRAEIYASKLKACLPSEPMWHVRCVVATVVHLPHHSHTLISLSARLHQCSGPTGFSCTATRHTNVLARSKEHSNKQDCS